MSEPLILTVVRPTPRSETHFTLAYKYRNLQCTAMKDGEDEPAITFEGRPYHLHFAYSQLLRVMIPHLMVSEGDYKGFIGPQLRDGTILVAPEAFDKFFWINIWQHGTSTAGDPVVWRDEIRTFAVLEQRLKEGWLVEKPECKEKAQ